MSYSIPYHLRHHKAIERNLFLFLLKKMNGHDDYDIKKYRYVGFGAPFLEDFKVMHWEFGINDMHCIEANAFAHSRQKFNNPLHFIELFPKTSTDYLTSSSFKDDKNQIIWLDYTSPGEIREQLQDIEFLAQKVKAKDIVKFTFNASAQSFQNSHDISKSDIVDQKKILAFLKKDATYQKYFPDDIKVENIIGDFSVVLRAMAIRAINRGLSSTSSELSFNHVCSFTYKDGQLMTTVTGIICPLAEFEKIITKTGLRGWEFYTPNDSDDLIKSLRIEVPDMTFLERAAVDRLIPASIENLIKNLQFTYGTSEADHKKLMESYCKYYRYLPYYAKVTY